MMNLHAKGNGKDKKRVVKKEDKMIVDESSQLRQEPFETEEAAKYDEELTKEIRKGQEQVVQRENERKPMTLLC